MKQSHLWFALCCLSNERFDDRNTQFTFTSINISFYREIVHRSQLFAALFCYSFIEKVNKNKQIH